VRRGGPTGAPEAWPSAVVAVAKRRLQAGEVLDGEGGFCVWGRQCPAERSLADGLLPLGLAHNVCVTREIREGNALTWSDVACDPNELAVGKRREMEAGVGRRGSPQIGG